ncbi:SGNH/GDSL hydrolase family protein [Actinophytocola sp.]|jgi:lysophospholipase L1-like esterase|uniref:SGNH/GDSL hydrolase family protein n=1 Tax=Actinophytocola sp. TaxID=1872138 RepID=UPI002D71195B|nr:SGNH/GDSL hydrolase family protein [Actinophytocola sp.]HYQ69829.1 SGNH/GDSL hydrolase family protein [Actinophytocola sp.]
MRRLLVFGAVVVTLVGSGAVASSTTGQQRRAPILTGWVGTWSASPSTGVANTPNGYPNFSIRNVIHTSIGGGTARVRLSNTFGTSPLTFGKVTVAVAESNTSPAARPGTMRTLTFDGQPSVVVPAAAEVLSDPVRLTVPRDGDLLVTTYVPTPSGPVTYHAFTGQTSFFTRNGDFADQESGAAFTEQTNVWHYVSGVDVRSAVPGSVVTFGDSITDGVGSTNNANHRWPDLLADRLRGRLGVLNAGISGNRLLLDVPGSGFGRNALARFADDVLGQGDVRSIIVLEGVNDIQQEPHQTDPAAIISAYHQMIAQAHARGIRVIGATILPFKGWRAWNETLEATRVAVNTWIRTSGEFDAVVDFDRVTRDPADPQALLAAYDSGDHLHPGDAGYQAMANAVDLSKL